MRYRPKISFLALCVYSSFAASEEFNLDFIQGSQVVPSILKNDSAYPAGQYSVEVVVNKDNTDKKMPLTITDEAESKGELCFSSQWLAEAGVLVNTDAFNDTFDKTAQCYVLSKKPHTSVDFDYSSQSLVFNIPQAYMLSKTDPVRWDYGVNGGRLRYNANFNKTSDNDLNAFGNVNLGINIGRWVLSGDVNASHSGDKTELTSSDLSLSTAISQVQGDFMLGKSQTRTELFSDFGFYGVALRSNSNMVPWDTRGYAPDITGVAPSTSRITVKQNGYTVYSKVVPAGPYRLDDLRPMGNGDLVVTVEDESGHKTETVYPVTTLPTLLRAGELQYNVAVGKKDDTNELNKAFSGNGIFWLGSVDYGFSTTTLNTAAILHNDYQGAGTGITQMLGMLGALSLSANVSKANYDNGEEKNGRSISIKYAKRFNEGTDLQILTYRYQTEGYTEFSAFDPKKNWFYGNQKSRYEARLSHRFDDMYLSGSYWRQDYWNQSGYDEGGTLSLSTTIFDSTSLYVNSSYTRNAWSSKPDYLASVSVSIPFTVGGVRHFSNNSISHSRNNGTTFNTGASAMVNERFNYSVNANSGSEGERGASVSASYAFDTIQTNLGLSQSKSRYGSSQTGISGSVSGSVLGTGDSGLIFTKESSDTMGIVRVPDVEGVSVNGSMPTNKKGYTAVWLSGYSENNISINMDNVPDNVEFDTTNWKVVPTEKALIYREFGVEHVKRYILRVRGHNGKYLTGGNAFTEQGLRAGFISNNGVLLMNMLAEPKNVSVDTGNGMVCRFSMHGLKANTNKVQEVRCE